MKKLHINGPRQFKLVLFRVNYTINLGTRTRVIFLLRRIAIFLSEVNFFALIKNEKGRNYIAAIIAQKAEVAYIYTLAPWYIPQIP